MRQIHRTASGPGSRQRKRDEEAALLRGRSPSETMEIGFSLIDFALELRAGAERANR